MENKSICIITSSKGFACAWNCDPNRLLEEERGMILSLELSSCLLSAASQSLPWGKRTHLHFWVLSPSSIGTCWIRQISYLYTSLKLMVGRNSKHAWLIGLRIRFLWVPVFSATAMMVTNGSVESKEAHTMNLTQLEIEFYVDTCPLELQYFVLMSFHNDNQQWKA